MNYIFSREKSGLAPLLLDSDSEWFASQNDHPDFLATGAPQGAKIANRGRHGFDGSSRDPKACRAPPARNRVENWNCQLTVGFGCPSLN